MFTESVRYLAEMLEKAGVSATFDPRDLTLPGVWLTPESGDFQALSGERGQVTINLACIVPNRGASIDLPALDELITKIENVFSPGSWRIEALNLANLSADPLPAATCKIITEWSKKS